MKKFQFKDFDKEDTTETKDSSIEEFIKIAQITKSKNFEKMNWYQEKEEATEEKKEEEKEEKEEKSDLQQQFELGYETAKKEITDNLEKEYNQKIEDTKKDTGQNIESLLTSISQKIEATNEDKNNNNQKFNSSIIELIISTAQAISNNRTPQNVSEEIKDFIFDITKKEEHSYTIKVHPEMSKLVNEKLQNTRDIKIISDQNLTNFADCVVEYNNTTIQKITSNKIKKIEEIIKNELLQSHAGLNA